MYFLTLSPPHPSSLSLSLSLPPSLPLQSELHPEADTLLASPKYRSDLAGSLLYKTLLSIYKSDSQQLRSGGDYLHRPISSGLQTYQEMTSEFPLKQPMPKKTAPLQVGLEKRKGMQREITRNGGPLTRGVINYNFDFN